jgi:hypothetical protein
VKEPFFQIKFLIRLQRVSWYLIFGCFLLATFLYLLQLSIAESVAFWGLIALLTMTLVKIFLLAEQFRAARLYRFWLLSYTLLLILLSTVLLKVYL